MSNLVRDETTVPIVKQLFGGFHDYLADAARHADDRQARARPGPPCAAAIGHALAFTTWQSLVREQGLDDRDAVDVMCRLVAAAGESARHGQTAA